MTLMKYAFTIAYLCRVFVARSRMYLINENVGNVPFNGKTTAVMKALINFSFDDIYFA